MINSLTPEGPSVKKHKLAHHVGKINNSFWGNKNDFEDEMLFKKEEEGGIKNEGLMTETVHCGPLDLSLRSCTHPSVCSTIIYFFNNKLYNFN